MFTVPSDDRGGHVADATVKRVQTELRSVPILLSDRQDVFFISLDVRSYRAITLLGSLCALFVNKCSRSTTLVVRDKHLAGAVRKRSRNLLLRKRPAILVCPVLLKFCSGSCEQGNP